MTINEMMSLVFRWVHVMAGVMWIGHLWFFNFVNAMVVQAMDADSKRRIVPQLMPRALYWFRWSAVYTWISGFFLLGLVYYGGGVLTDPNQPVGLARAAGIVSLVLAPIVYDVVWRLAARHELAGAVVSILLMTGAGFGLGTVMTGRSVFIHMGAMFGTIMLMNVWQYVWPQQRRIINALKAGAAPPPEAAAIVNTRAKHSTYLSVPLLFFMVSNHFPGVYGSTSGWILLPMFVGLGWVITKALYLKAASEAPAKIQ